MSRDEIGPSVKEGDYQESEQYARRDLEPRRVMKIEDAPAARFTQVRACYNRKFLIAEVQGALRTDGWILTAKDLKLYLGFLQLHHPLVGAWLAQSFTIHSERAGNRSGGLTGWALEVTHGRIISWRHFRATMFSRQEPALWQSISYDTKVAGSP